MGLFGNGLGFLLECLWKDVGMIAEFFQKLFPKDPVSGARSGLHGSSSLVQESQIEQPRRPVLDKACDRLRDRTCQRATLSSKVALCRLRSSPDYSLDNATGGYSVLELHCDNSKS